MFSSFVFAEVQYVGNVKIESVSVYDDFEGGIIFIGMSKVLSGCPKGGYLKRSSNGFKELYALVLTSATTRQELTFQLYDDRKIGNRCEIDALLAFYN